MDTKQQTEQDNYCLGVQMLIKRMNDKPEEFAGVLGDYDNRWRDVLLDLHTWMTGTRADIDTDDDPFMVHALLEEEAKALWSAYIHVGRATFSSKVFQYITELDSPEPKRRKR